MVKAQEWLNTNYPKNGVCQLEVDTDNFGKRRNEIEVLDISNKDLEGELDLSDFVNLNKLECNGCQLTNLLVSDCKKITEVDCSYNNSLAGGCEIFQNLNKLKKLDIKYTQIDSNLEYLPESLEKICCSEGTELQKELEDYDGDIVSWREFYGQSQKWIDENYPKETRKEIVELNIGDKKLEKGLRLLGFTNLKRLNCHDNNRLIKLDLSSCRNLKLLTLVTVLHWKEV